MVVDSELAHLALSLGAILVILLILSWVVRRLLNTRIEQANVTSSIKVLEKRYLNPKAVIYVVAIGNKNIIVGESPQGLVNLGEIRDDRVREGDESPHTKMKMRMPAASWKKTLWLNYR